jgi:hypothetical protein
MEIEEPHQIPEGGARGSARVACAVVATFLLPGLMLWLGGLLFANKVFPGPPPQSFVDWLLLAGALSLSIGLWGSPIFIADLFVWRFLYRRGIAKPAAFAVVGLVSSWVPLCIWWPKLPPAALVSIFSAAGIGTGLAVWSIAYLGASADRQLPEL